MEGQQCEFTLDPTACDRLHPDGRLQSDVLTDESTWRCPYDALAESNRCLAHTPPADRPDDVDETGWLLDQVARIDETTRAGAARPGQFVGATFRTLSFGGVDSATVPNSLDLRFADLGTVRFTGTTPIDSVDLSGATVDSVEIAEAFTTLRGLGATVDVVSADEATLDSVDLRDATLQQVSLRRGHVGKADLRHATVDSLALDKSDIDHAHLDCLSVETVRGHHATVEILDADNATFGEIDFYYADLGQADFRNVAATDAIFKGVTFEGAYFNGAELAVSNWIGVEVDNGHFGGAGFEQASFHGATIVEGGFDGAYLGWVNVQDATIEEANFHGATLEHVSFRNTEFTDARFTSVDCAGLLDLRNAVFDSELQIAPRVEDPPSGALIDLSGSDIGAGTLVHTDTRTLYNLRNATLGGVTFESEPDECNVIEHVFFLRTRFDGFDFRDDDDVDLRQVGYNIHRMFDGVEGFVARCLGYGPALAGRRERDDATNRDEHTNPAGVLGPVPDTDEYGSLRAHVGSDLTVSGAVTATAQTYTDPSATDLEYTYLLAKNGANAIHDNESSSRFFVQEMLQRRRRHAELVAESDSLRGPFDHALDWVKNSVFWWSSGYGERPSRVILMSLGLIGVFSGLYYALAPNLYESLFDYASLSIGSFVTLIIGDVGDIPIPSIRILTQFEAFIGAFFIAMFVFTLTRSIRR